MHKYLMVPTIITLKTLKQEYVKFPVKYSLFIIFITFIYIGVIIYGPTVQLPNTVLFRLINQVFIFIIVINKNINSTFSLYLKVVSNTLKNYKKLWFFIVMQYRLYLLFILEMLNYPIYKFVKIQNAFLFDSLIVLLIAIIIIWTTFRKRYEYVKESGIGCQIQLRNYFVSFIVKELFFNKKDPIGFIVLGSISVITYSLVFIEKNNLQISVVIIIFCIATYFWLAIISQQIDNLKHLTIITISPFNKRWLIKINIVVIMPLVISLLVYYLLKNRNILEFSNLFISTILYFYFLLYRMIFLRTTTIIKLTILFIESCVLIFLCLNYFAVYIFVMMFLLNIFYYNLSAKIMLTYRNEIYD